MMTDKITSITSSYVPAILISSLFAIPLFNSSYLFNGIISGKNYGFYLILTIIIAYNIPLYIFNKNRNIPLSKIDFVLIIYVLWNFLSAILTNDSYINDKKSELFFLTIFYFIVKGHQADNDNKNSFLYISAFILFSVAIAEAMTGILQLHRIIPSNNPYFKVTGTFNNPAPYALLLAITYAYALAFFSFNDVSYKPIKYMALASCVLILNIIPFTLNRASWIGITAGTLLIGVFKLACSNCFLKINKRVKIGLTALFVLLMGACMLWLYNLKKESSEGRLLVWKVSSNMIKHAPVTGIGYGRFASEYNLYQADYFKGSHEKNEELLAGNVKLAFNDYIEIWAETGIIGLILFISLVYFILGSFTLKCDKTVLFLCPLIVFLILSAVSYPFNKLTTKIPFFFFVALLSSFYGSDGPASGKFEIPKWAVIAILLISLPLAVRNIVKYDKYRTFLYASNTLNAKNLETSEEYFRQVYNSLRYEPYFSLKYSECLYENRKYEEALEVLTDAKDKVPDPELFMLMGNVYLDSGENLKAQCCFEEAGYMVPGRLLPKYYLARLYYQTGENRKADSIVRQALRMDLKIRSDTTLALIEELKEMYKTHNKTTD